MDIERDRLLELRDVLDLDRTRADDGIDLVEAERELSLIERVRVDVEAVLAALDRLQEDTSELCEVCSAIISDKGRPLTSLATRPGNGSVADRWLGVEDLAGSRDCAPPLPLS